MRAAIIYKKDKVHLSEEPRPELLDGEALIKVSYCGICGSDIHVLKGEHPTARFPVVPGHEFVGELVEMKGYQGEEFQLGDTVVAQPYRSCGNCEPCAKGRDNICRHLEFMGVHINGGFAEYVKVLTRKMYKIPKEIDRQLAALAEPIAVAVHDVRSSGMQVGDTVLIIGGGPIGMLIAMVAEQAGARKVVISEISEYRRQIAEDLGYITVNPIAEGFAKELDRISDHLGFDVSFEVSGSKPGITAAVEYTKNTGTVMVIGMTTEAYPVQLAQVFAKELRLQGARIHSQYNFIGAVELLKQGVCNDKFQSLISKIYKLDEIEEAFTYVQKPGEFFKVLVEVNAEGEKMIENIF